MSNGGQIRSAKNERAFQKGAAEEQTPEKSVSQRVVEFGTTHVGKKVGSGECWDLPFEALKAAEAMTPWDLPGKNLYVWGEEIKDLKEAQPGDILQFEGVVIQGSWVTREKIKIKHQKDPVDAKVTHWENFNFGEKHSAIVEKVDKDLFFTTLNAHIQISNKGETKPMKEVQRLQINLSPENITGKIYLYRPTTKKTVTDK